LQCVAVCCSALQCVAVCYSVLQCVAGSDCFDIRRWRDVSAVVCHFCVAVCCSVLQCVAVCCGVLQVVIALTNTGGGMYLLSCAIYIFTIYTQCSQIAGLSLYTCACVRCSVWRCVAVLANYWFLFTFMCVRALQCVAVCCGVLQCSKNCWSLFTCMCVCVLQCVAVCCSVLQCVAVCCSVLPCSQITGLSLHTCLCVCCSVLQRDAACCSVLQCVVYLIFSFYTQHIYIFFTQWKKRQCVCVRVS